jgi:hypothetical protein
MLVAGAIASMIHAVTTRDGAPRAQSLQRGAPDACDFSLMGLPKPATKTATCIPPMTKH